MSQREWVEKDYYATLGVASTASAAEITKAYRKLAQKYHPDTNPGNASAESRFKEISQAHDVIGDPRKRTEYDQLRTMMSGGPRFSGFGGGQRINVEDLFGNLFGGDFGRAERRPVRGPDLETEVSLSFMESISGPTVTLQVGDRSVKTRLPQGVKDGGRIRLAGKGADAGPGTQRGDLYVRVRVGAHKFFGRKDNDVTVRVPVLFTEAALGADVEVPTLNGKPVTLKIPAGTPSGKTFRVRGKGPELAGRRTDLFVTVDVAVPAKLSKQQRKLIEQLAELGEASPREELDV